MMIVVGRDDNLVQMIAALHLVRRRPDLLDRGQQQSHQHGNDRDDNEKFDQRKRTT
jgi:hypothetical protein